MGQPRLGTRSSSRAEQMVLDNVQFLVDSGTLTPIHFETARWGIGTLVASLNSLVAHLPPCLALSVALGLCLMCIFGCVIFTSVELSFCLSAKYVCLPLGLPAGVTRLTVSIVSAILPPRQQHHDRMLCGIPPPLAALVFRRFLD